jgi:hypothetical protein
VRPVAVAVIHGVGTQGGSFADVAIARLLERYVLLGGERGDLVLRAVHWAPVLQEAEDTLWRRMPSGGPLSWNALRRFMVDFAADAIAYQVSPRDRKVYDAVHAVFATTLHALAAEAGPGAPLCVLSHSLGTVIASNYLYDLQVKRPQGELPDPVVEEMGDTPLERGETLSLLFTLGSPLALWSLRWPDFGRPIRVPGRWVNFYDRDDVIGWPLKTLNDAYREAVTEDREVNVGPIWRSWNPASHSCYFLDRSVIDPIARAVYELARPETASSSQHA